MRIVGATYPGYISTTSYSKDPPTHITIKDMKEKDEVIHPFCPGETVYHWRYGKLKVKEIVNRFGDISLESEKDSNWDITLNINAEELSYHPYNLIGGGLTWDRHEDHYLGSKCKDDILPSPEDEDDQLPYWDNAGEDFDFLDEIRKESKNEIELRKEAFEIARRDCKIIGGKESALQQQLEYADAILKWLVQDVE